MATKTKQDLFLLATLIVFTGLACWQYKFAGYASLLGIVPIAIAISRINAVSGVSAGTVRSAAILLSSQALLLAASYGFNQVFGATKPLTESMRADSDACIKPDAIRDLAGLPPGLMASYIDIGAYIAALTPHRALAAPYHRIAGAIIANYDIYSARKPADAAAVLKREHVDYVVICRGIDVAFTSDAAWKGTLGADLAAGRPPNFLVPVPLSNTSSIFRVWKVDRAALNLPPSTAAASAP